MTVSTNLGPFVNRRGLFGREALADVFKRERIPSTFAWDISPKGQHFELGIAENNLFLMLAALGLSHSLFGERLFPVGTLYDPFIARGLDALNYACYQDARFILVATPSGVSLAPEGGAHQSIGTPLIGISQDGIAAFEPAFVDELAAILGWSFAYLQRSGEGEQNERNWLRDETGGSVYLRLSTRPLEQPSRTLDADLKRAIVDGAYWLREPGPNPEIVVAYQGAVAPEAIEAVGLMARGPPRRRPARHHLGRSAERRLDGGAAGARARPRPRRQPHRAAARRRAAELRARHGDRRASLARSAGSARCTATARARSASSISGSPARSPTSTATTASTRTGFWRRRKRSRRASRSGICGCWRDEVYRRPQQGVSAKGYATT